MDEPRTPAEFAPAEDVPVEEVERFRRPTLRRVAIRVIVGGGVIAFLVTRGDADRIADVMRGARPASILAAFGSVLLGLVLSAFRWQAYLEPLGLRLSVATLFRLYYVGTFFNAFLPTGVGGDAYKAIRLKRGRGTLSAAVASVFLDRFAGIIGLALIGLVGVGARLAAGDRGRVVLLAGVLALGVLGAAGMLLLFGERLLFGPVGRSGIGQRARRLLHAIGTAGRDRRAAPRGLLYGLVFQGLVLVYHVLLARALRLDVPVAVMAAVFVISSLATLIPLTINGLGFREGAYIWTLGRYGIGHDQALAFALLSLGVVLASSAVGGIVYMIAGGEVADEEIARGAAPEGAWARSPGAPWPPAG